MKIYAFNDLMQRKFLPPAHNFLKCLHFDKFNPNSLYVKRKSKPNIDEFYMKFSTCTRNTSDTSYSHIILWTDVDESKINKTINIGSAHELSH